MTAHRRDSFAYLIALIICTCFTSMTSLSLNCQFYGDSHKHWNWFACPFMVISGCVVGGAHIRTFSAKLWSVNSIAWKCASIQFYLSEFFITYAPSIFVLLHYFIGDSTLAFLNVTPGEHTVRGRATVKGQWKVRERALSFQLTSWIGLHCEAAPPPSSLTVQQDL